MHVIDQPRPEPTPIAGLAHATWCGHDEGLAQLSVWRQTLAPGAATPPHRHECDEVVLCLGGQGELHVDGRAHRFAAEQTIVLPARQMHQIFNTGTQPLEILSAFGATPVAVFLPGDERFELPWRS